jgi:hypothetical protein
MGLPVPRFKGGRILTGSIEIWKLFSNRYGFTYDQLLPYIATIFGVLVALLFLLLVCLAYRWWGKHSFKFSGNFILSCAHPVVRAYAQPAVRGHGNHEYLRWGCFGRL